MRLGIVLAATGAAAVTAWAVAAAQDGFDSRAYRPLSDPASRRTVHYFARNGSTSQQTVPARPATVPGVRNYYKDLFNEPDQTGSSATDIRTAGAGADDSSLIHARYDRQRSGAPASEIRQLSDQRSEPTHGAPTTTAPSLPGFAAPGSQEADPFAAFERRPQLNAPATTAPQAAVPHSSAPQLALPARASSIGANAQPAGPAISAPASPRRTIVRPPIRQHQTFNTPIPTTDPAAEASPQSTIPTTPSGISPASAEEPSQRLAQAFMGGPAAVEVRWERVSEITVGQECRCELVVKNSGASAAGDVAVEAFFPRSVRLTAADPKPTTSDDHLTWTISSLPAGGERRIAISLIPSEQGDLQIAAYVRYTEAAATTIAVREPQIEVALSGPEEVAIGETVSETITVSNPGSGTAEDVRVELTLPPGLEHAKGSKMVMPIGALAAGQSQTIRLALFATQGGPQSIHVRAMAGESLRHEASANVIVSAPTLNVIAEGPGLRYVGRDAVYRIRVTNDGRAVANNVRVTHAVPEGFTFVRADKRGQFNSGSHEIVWYLSQVEAGQSVDLAAELTASSLGDHQHTVKVTGEGGSTAEAIVETAVDGTASLVVEVLDLDDPIEVGAETAYEVRIRNEGTKSASNVAVACEVPTGVAALSARGPTAHHGEASLLTFAPIAELEPGKAALYRVVVRATAAGKHRFRVRLTSDSIDEPLIHEELTHYYAD